MPRTRAVHCAVCGIVFQAQRTSARYCRDCKPKALILNTVIRQLNRLASIDSSGLNVLIDNGWADIDDRAEVSIQLMDAFPVLEARNGYNLLDVLNIALGEYGRIGFDGHEFTIRPYEGARTLRMQGLRAHVNPYVGDFSNDPYWFTDRVIIGVDAARVEGVDDSQAAIAFQSRTDRAIHISELTNRRSPARRERNGTPNLGGQQEGDGGNAALARSSQSESSEPVEADGGLSYTFLSNPRTGPEWDECLYQFLTTWALGYHDGNFLAYLRNYHIETYSDRTSSGEITTFTLQDGRVLRRAFQYEIQRLLTDPDRELTHWRDLMGERRRSNQTRMVRENIRRGQVGWTEMCWLEYLFGRGESVESDATWVLQHPEWWRQEPIWHQMLVTWVIHHNEPMTIEQQTVLLRQTRNSQGRARNI